MIVSFTLKVPLSTYCPIEKSKGWFYSEDSTLSIFDMQYPIKGRTHKHIPAPHHTFGKALVLVMGFSELGFPSLAVVLQTCRNMDGKHSNKNYP